jgi:hypothetical protein
MLHLGGTPEMKDIVSKFGEIINVDRSELTITWSEEQERKAANMMT